MRGPVDREKITLTGAPETMLATLYCRALDSEDPRSVLHDREAARAVARIDYDFERTRVRRNATGVAFRAKQLDDWTAEFLAAHPDATVLHLACGLDTRVHRVAPPAGARWFDVDYPQVIELRTRLLPGPPGQYRALGASVTDEDWLEQVPADRPTVVVFEGLSMYLREAEGRRLIERIVERFPSGQLVFDVFGTVGIRAQHRIAAVRNSGATLHWGVDDPRVIEGWHDRLELLDAVSMFDIPGLQERLPLVGRWVVALLPKRLRNAGRVLRFRF